MLPSAEGPTEQDTCFQVGGRVREDLALEALGSGSASLPPLSLMAASRGNRRTNCAGHRREGEGQGRTVSQARASKTLGHEKKSGSFFWGVLWFLTLTSSSLLG